MSETQPNLAVERNIDPRPVVSEMVAFLETVDLAIETPLELWRLKLLAAHVRNECRVLAADRPKLFTGDERVLLESLLARAERAVGTRKVVADISQDVALLGQVLDRCVFQYAFDPRGGDVLTAKHLELLKAALTRPQVLEATQNCLPGIRADGVVQTRILSALSDLPAEIRSAVVSAHYPEVYAFEPVDSDECVEACQT